MDVVWLEIVGLALVLISSFVKFYFTDPISDIHRGVLQYRQEHKIDYIWMLLTALNAHVYPMSTKKGYAFNNDGVDEGWEPANPSTLAGKQARGFKSVESQMFLLGSILLVGAKMLPLIAPTTFHERSALTPESGPRITCSAPL